MIGSSNIPHPGSRRGASSKSQARRLIFGASLEIGRWMLDVLSPHPFFIAPLLLVCLTAPAADLTPAQLQFFENKIRPILANICYKCHSAQAEKVKGGLLLDSREGLLKGGESGPAIVPGNAEQSRLIKAVRYTDPDLQMPPKGKRLSEEQIADLVTWVNMGTPE